MRRTTPRREDTTMATEADKALERIRAASARYDAAADKAAEAKAKRDALIYDTRERFGTPYADLAAAMGKTRDRVSQVLTERRRAQS